MSRPTSNQPAPSPGHIAAALDDIPERPLGRDLKELWAAYGDNPFGNVCEYWNRTVPAEDAVVWLNSDGDVAETLTYSELYSRMAKLNQFLRDEGLKTGDRLILCYPPGVDFIVAFFACITSGLVAVPVYPPDPTKGLSDVPRFCDIHEISQCRTALTNSMYRRVAQVISTVAKDPRWRSVKWICTDEVLKRQPGAAGGGEFPNLSPHHPAFLQVRTQ